MSEARSTILTTIRNTLARRRGEQPAADEAAIAAEAKHLRARADATRPDRVSGRPDEAFLARLVSPPSRPPPSVWRRCGISRSRCAAI